MTGTTGRAEGTGRQRKRTVDSGPQDDWSSPAEKSPAGITVLFDTRSRHWGQNPYMQMLTSSVSAEVVPRGFSWHYALCGRYDVFHLHWPEFLLKMQSPMRRTAARVLFALLVVRLKLSGTAVVRTRHNRSAHVQIGWLDTRLLILLQRQVSLEIRMNRLDVRPLEGSRDPALGCVLHGNYRPYIDALGGPGVRKATRAEGTRLLSFGILRPYKNFHEVVRAVGDVTSGTDVTLAIMGSPADPDYAATLTRLVDSVGDRVRLSVGRVEDSELIARIINSDFVVIPYEDLYSSGVALLSLSLNVPVVVRETDAARELQAEFGERWVRTYHGAMTPDVIERLAVEDTHTPGTSGCVFWSPDRQWPEIGRQTLTEYRRAIASVRRDGKIGR